MKGKFFPVVMVLLALAASAIGAASQERRAGVEAAVTALARGLENRNIQEVSRYLSADFRFQNSRFENLDRRQYVAALKRTLDALQTLQVRFSPVFPARRNREVTLDLEFHFDGKAAPAFRPESETRLESGATLRLLADPQYQRRIVYVGTAQQTWIQTAQGWRLKRMTILTEKRTVDPRPFTLPMQPGGAADREVIASPSASLFEEEPLFNFHTRPF
jgi:hypothetical protein